MTSPRERNVIGYTFSINSKKYELASKILDRAIEEIEALEKVEELASRDVVYQVELALFPVTKGKGYP